MIKMDAVAHKFDANETLFMQGQMESIEAKLYEFKKKELRYRMFVPVSNRDHPGAESITYRMYDMVGMARVISNYADDLPRADVFGKEFTQAVKGLGSSFGYSTQEIRTAAMNNTPLDAMKAAASRRSIHEKESAICWNGDPASGLKGFLDNENVPLLATPTGSGGYTWLLKTPDEIIKDVRLMVTQIRTQSKAVHAGDTLLLPIAQYDILANTPRSTLSDMTILEFLTKPGNSFGLTTISWLIDELDNAFTGGTEDAAVMYENSPEVLEQRIPLEMITHPVQEKGLEMKIPVESRHGGVVIRYPLAIVFMTGI